MILALLTATITMLSAPQETTALPASPAELTGIGYSVKEGRSLLSLRCTAPVQPQVEEFGQKVVLHFTGMTVAERPGEAQLPFSDGDIASVAIRKEGPAALRVVVDLRTPGLKYSVAPGASGSILFTALSARRGRIDTTPMGAKSALAGPVDAPVTSTLKAVPQADPGSTAHEGAGLSIPAMIFAIVISGVSTTVVLFVLRKRIQPSTRDGVSIAAAFPGNRPAEPEENRRWEESNEQEEENAGGEPEEELPPEYAQAMVFRRMRAEVGLARTVNAAVVSPRKALELRSLAGGDGNPEALKTARRLGVGRGEIALATRLSKLRTPEETIEEVQQ
jgi:hypothetical protein